MLGRGLGGRGGGCRPGPGHREVLATKENVKTRTAETTRGGGGRRTQRGPAAHRCEPGGKILTDGDPRFEMNIHESTLREIHNQIDQCGRRAQRHRPCGMTPQYATRSSAPSKGQLTVPLR